MHERFVKEALHQKAVEKPVKLEIAHFGITKVKEASDYFDGFSPQGHLVLRGIMLHLRSGLILYLVASVRDRLAKR
jgi:hypothetical protein